MKKIKTLYLCNQKRCKTCSGVVFDQCFHTSDIRYAKHPRGERTFQKINDLYFEIERKEEPR